jgi:hypothetical protein
MEIDIDKVEGKNGWPVVVCRNNLNSIISYSHPKKPKHKWIAPYEDKDIIEAIVKNLDMFKILLVSVFGNEKPKKKPKPKKELAGLEPTHKWRWSKKKYQSEYTLKVYEILIPEDVLVEKWHITKLHRKVIVQWTKVN